MCVCACACPCVLVRARVRAFACGHVCVRSVFLSVAVWLELYSNLVNHVLFRQWLWSICCNDNLPICWSKMWRIQYNHNDRRNLDGLV